MSEPQKTVMHGLLMNISSWLLFVVLPCITLGWSGSSLIRQYEEIAIQSARTEMETAVEQICDFLDPENFLLQRFKIFQEAIMWENLEPQQIQLLYENHDCDALGIIPYIFKDGRLITPDSLLADTADRMQELWRFFHGYSQRSPLTNKTDAHEWFGLGFSRLKRRSGQASSVTFDGRHGRGVLGYFARDYLQKRDGGFMLAWRLPSPASVSEYLPPDMKANIRISFYSHEEAELAKSAYDSDNADSILMRRQVAGKMIVFQRAISNLRSSSVFRFLYAGLLILAIVLVSFQHASALQKKINAVSVRLKLAVLLLYAVALPLSILSWYGVKFISERRELLCEKAFSACQNAVSELETGFIKEKNKIHDFYRSYKKLPEMATDPGRLLGLFAGIERQQRMNWIEVSDINAEPLVTTHNPETADQIGIVGKVFARHGINTFLSHRLTARQKPVLSASELIMQEFLESPFGGWARIFESPDELHEISFGGYNLFWFWDVFTEPDFLSAFIVCDQHIHWSVKHYLRENLLRRSTHGHSALRLLAWSEDDSNFIGIENQEQGRDLQSFVSRVRRSAAPQIGRIEWDGEKWLVAGAPGRRLVSTIALAMYPMSEIDREIQNISNDLWLGAVFALLLTLLIGRLFSGTLLLPVERLVNGVRAMRCRETGHRIEVFQSDELGQLSESFNRAMEVLEDVGFARSIQSQMLLQKVPEIKGYVADVFNRAAADLGGDYCDIVALDDGRWLFIIGDVTGHGVSSSLVTAMTKAVVCQSAGGTGDSYLQIFPVLNDLLHSQFRRRKCITLQIAALQPETGRLQLTSAAHPFPFHFSNGKLKNVEIKGHPPVGFIKGCKEFPQTVISMLPGDCLIFYTDVFIETCDKSGNPIGITGFAGLCQSCQHLEPEQMRQCLVAEIEKLSDAELDDDQTLIILKRL